MSANDGAGEAESDPSRDSSTSGPTGLRRRELLQSLSAGFVLPAELAAPPPRDTAPSLGRAGSRPPSKDALGDGPDGSVASFREMATFLDPVETPTTVRELSALHRWAPGEERLSLGSMARRHTSPDRVDQRFLFLNTFLMDIKADDLIGGATEGTKPRVNARARELGRHLRDNVDVAALAEVWRTEQLKLILDQWPSEPAHADRITRRIPRDRPGEAFRRESKSKGSSGLVVVSEDASIVDGEFAEFNHETGFAESRADKGVVLAVLDVGLGPSNLRIYDTHLQAGNNLVALKQLLQLATFVRSTKRARDPAVVAGDFNISPGDSVGFRPSDVLDVGFDVPELLRRAVAERVEDGTPTGDSVDVKSTHDYLTDVLGVLGFRDLWATRNGTPGFTKNVHKRAVRREICPPDPDDERLCDDDVPSDVDDTARIDYVFASRPVDQQSFRMDFARPRRPRLLRPPNADGRGEIAVLSDHLGIRTTLRLVPA